MESLSLARERCEQRARRLVQVKFVSLPVELGLDPGLRQDDEGVTPVKTGAQFMAILRDFVSRVIGRLEAARP